ncbi:uncharacterized protein LOC129005078 isoform X1 [Macrosteles quadrilineatus]|nr:uncharacterized protein LOC129005078 isoform X1 [Macrosteles quadrilineatus]
MKGNAIPNIPRNNNDVVIQTPPPKLYTKVSRPVQQVDCPNSSEIEIETCQQKVSNEEIKDDLTSVDTSFTTVRAPVRTYKRTAPKRQHTASIQGQTKNEEQEIRQVAKFEISEKSKKDANQGFEIVRVQDLERKKGIEDRYRMNDIEINVNINDLLTSSEKEPSTLISTLLEKLHSCFYCNDLVADMKTHLVLQHPKKKEVLSALAFGKHKKEKMLTLLTRVGDFKHNCRVLEANTGFLICLGGWHHTFFTIDKSKFLPCPLCAAFIHIDCFTHHNECCMFKDVSETKVQEPEKNLLMKSQAMLSHLKKSEVKKLKDHYFYRLKGIFGSLAKNDELIMWIVSYLFINERCREEGLVLLTRLGFIVHLYSRVTGNSEGVKFENILRPDSVYALFEALRYFLREATGTGTTNLYKQLYSHISISAFVWRGECLFRGDLDAAKDAINFFDVFNNMYEKELKSDPTLQLKLSTQREVSYKQSKKKKPVVDVSNIERLKNLLNESIVKLTDALCSKAISNEAKAVWHELAADTLCYLCLTNPVDFTTIEQISVIEYALRPDSSIQNLVKCNKMMPLLFKFSERCTFVITVHHNSEIVIILSSAVKNAIDTLLKKRQEAGVSLTHRYIFSGCSGSDTRTLSALNCFCNLCLNQKEGLSPDVLGNWKKRRLISNIIHISEMPPKELESVKKYLESSRDNQSTLQIDNEENQEFEMREELEEALKIYEFSQSNQEIVFSDETSCSSESSVKGESSPTQ